MDHFKKKKNIYIYMCVYIHTHTHIYIYIFMDFPGGSDGKASVYNAGDLGLIPGSGRSPGEENGNPLQYYCLEKSHGQRSLVGYSPRCCKESDTTERLHFHFQEAGAPAGE